LARSGGWRGVERRVQERLAGRAAGGGRGARRRRGAAGGGEAAAEEGKLRQASPAASGAHRGASPPMDTAADPAGSAAQRAITTSPGEGCAGKEKRAAPVMNGHDAAKRGAVPRDAPPGKRGSAGERPGAEQPSARVRQEKGGGVGVGEAEGEGVRLSVGVAVPVPVGDRERVAVPVGDGEGVEVLADDAERVLLGVTIGVGVEGVQFAAPTELKKPRGHGVHAEAPVVLEKVFVPQDEQKEAPGSE
jgi:hypothetical protein